jgi:cell wall-associated NlpC family hydrolase
VSRASARPGDLVFFMSGGRPYHMGIRAGAGKVWHSPKTGDHVKLSTIWTSAVAYGRVR